MVRYQTAFASTEAREDTADLLRRVHDAYMEGRPAPAAPREVIRRSWDRVRRAGVDPDAPAGEDDATERRAAHDGADSRDAATMRAVVTMLRPQLDPLLADGETLLAVSDSRAHILDRLGRGQILHGADDLGFRPGRSWSERSVGTNAIGTALAAGGPVHVHAAEHYCASQHRWSCAASPVRDPRTGQVVGVIDLSFRSSEASPTAVVLASSLCVQVELAMRDAHRRSLARLRSSVGSRPRGSRWVLVDGWGWVADAEGLSVPSRILLPDDPHDGILVDGLGPARLEPVPGGWLLVGDAPPSTLDEGVGEHLEVELSATRCVVTVEVSGHTWTHVLLGRRADLVRALADHPLGMSGRELAVASYGRTDAETAVRAEVHRIRKEIGDLVLTRPYRLAEGVIVRRRVEGE